MPNLVRVFEILRHHKVLLNVGKCAFGAGSSKFLGYMITTRGIEVNPIRLQQFSSLTCLVTPKKCKSSL